ncbi:hypothetical protein CcaverHIS002_0701430 [Cutaneotrichosporon cavernicola]|nr:hypothetical protein CcaverHIS002_0701430 [Cutaneotrichosporon cavernicola]
MLALLVGVLAATTALAASTTITLDSYAAQLDYRPDSTNRTNAGSSWNASFTGFPWSERVGGIRGGQVGTGVGYHWIRGDANPNAVVNYEFYGTGIQFYGYFGYLDTGDGSGNASDSDSGSATISIAGKRQANQQDVETTGTLGSKAISLGAFKDLPLGRYQATLRPTAGVISFTHLVVNMEVGGRADQVAQALANPHTFHPYVLNADNSLSPDPKFGIFKGDDGGPGGWGGQQSNDNRRVGTKGFRDSVEISLGVGNSFVAINGTSNINHGMVRVVLDPAPPNGDLETNVWACTTWQVLQTTLFAVGLDPDTEYKLTVSNMQDQGQQDDKLAWLDITSLTLWKVPTTAKAKANNVIGGNPGSSSSSSKQSVPLGAIIGAVVGGVVLLAAIGLAIWFFRRKKSQSKSTRAQSYHDQEYDATPFVIDREDPPAQMHPQMTHLHPHGTLSGSDLRSSMSTHHMSWSDSSSSVPGAYAGSLAGLAAGMMPPGVSSRAPAKLGPQPEPAHHLATDAGSLGIGDATPVGEMPPTYDHSWVGSTASGSVGAPEGTLTPGGSLARQSAYSDMKGNLMAL